MIRKGPPASVAAPKLPVEPRRGAARAERSSVASMAAWRQTSATAPAPRARRGFPQMKAMVASLITGSRRDRLAAATIEPRWYSTDLAAGSTAPPGADVPSPSADHRATASGRATALDRRCAAATMIVAATLAVAVSVVVAPQLRSANPPAYPERGALIAEGAGIYETSCAAWHG